MPGVVSFSSLRPFLTEMLRAGLQGSIKVARQEYAGGRRAEAAGLRRGLVRVAERSRRMARGVRPEDSRRRRGSRPGPVDGVAVG